MRKIAIKDIRKQDYFYTGSNQDSSYQHPAFRKEYQDDHGQQLLSE